MQKHNMGEERPAYNRCHICGDKVKGRGERFRQGMQMHMNANRRCLEIQAKVAELPDEGQRTWWLERGREIEKDLDRRRQARHGRQQGLGREKTGNCMEDTNKARWSGVETKLNAEYPDKGTNEHAVWQRMLDDLCRIISEAMSAKLKVGPIDK